MFITDIFIYLFIVHIMEYLLFTNLDYVFMYVFVGCIFIYKYYSYTVFRNTFYEKHLIIYCFHFDLI